MGLKADVVVDRFLKCFLVFVLLPLFFTRATGVLEAVDTPVDTISKGSKPYPNAISFFVIDLKYNEEQGVKICEIQPGSVSKFAGNDFAYSGTALAAENFCNCLSLYQDSFWYIPRSVCDKQFAARLAEKGWHPIQSTNDLEKDLGFQKKVATPIYDPLDIHQYHGLLYIRKRHFDSFENFKQKYPGTIILDEYFYPFAFDKYVMNKLLSEDDRLKQLKCKWILCPKYNSDKVVNKIMREVDSDRYVIKPRNGTLGRGVIIVDKADLPSVIKKITEKGKALSRMKEKAYRFWRHDKSANFLIEEFVPSDEIQIPHLGNRTYDPTMRVLALLVLSQKKIHVHYLACYWKLPKKSTQEGGSLNDLHKSFGHAPYFAKVSPDTQQKVEQQLSSTLPRLFSLMMNKQ